MLQFTDGLKMVEAWRLDFDKLYEIPDWLVRDMELGAVFINYNYSKDKPFPYLVVMADPGVMIALPGDWLVRGPSGGILSCTPDVFDKTYRQVFNVGEN